MGFAKFALWMFLGIMYAVFPADLIPDILPIIGWVDDAAVLLISLYQSTSKSKKK